MDDINERGIHSVKKLAKTFIPPLQLIPNTNSLRYLSLSSIPHQKSNPFCFRNRGFPTVNYF